LDQPRRNGPLPRLSTEQQAEIEAWVDGGADPKCISYDFI
jgi:hypothetical protein